MIPEVVLRLACGLALMWCLAPRRQITSGFFRIQMLLTLGLGVLTAVTASQIHADAGHVPLPLSSRVFVIGNFLVILSFLGSIMWTLERRKAGTAIAFLILLTAAGGVLQNALGTALQMVSHSADLATGGLNPNAWNNWMVVVRWLGDSFTSAWLLGAVTATMLLGHWYLTATGMPLTPLAQYNLLFAGAVLLRTIFTCWTTWTDWDQAGVNWVLSLLHWAGLAGPLIMSGLTMGILKHRNTQSATGVLYAATILVFLGEMAAAQLAWTKANPPGV